MGMVARKLRKSGNQQFVAPRTLETELDAEQLFKLTAQLTKTLNDNYDAWVQSKNRVTRWLNEGPYHHYYCALTRVCVLVSFQEKPANILKLAPGKTLSMPGYWMAKLWPARSEDGHRPAAIELVRWVTDEDGKIKNKDRYEQFVSELQQQLTMS